MLTCTYGGVPQATVMWYTLNGNVRRNIPVSDAEYVVESTTTQTELTIRNVGDDDNVKYVCESTNIVNGSMVMMKIEKEIKICCKF